MRGCPRPRLQRAKKRRPRSQRSCRRAWRRQARPRLLSRPRPGSRRRRRLVPRQPGLQRIPLAAWAARQRRPPLSAAPARVSRKRLPPAPGVSRPQAPAARGQRALRARPPRRRAAQPQRGAQTKSARPRTGTRPLRASLRRRRPRRPSRRPSSAAWPRGWRCCAGPCSSAVRWARAAGPAPGRAAQGFAAHGEAVHAARLLALLLLGPCMCMYATCIAPRLAFIEHSLRARGHAGAAPGAGRQRRLCHPSRVDRAGRLPSPIPGTLDDGLPCRALCAVTGCAPLACP